MKLNSVDNMGFELKGRIGVLCLALLLGQVLAPIQSEAVDFKRLWHSAKASLSSHCEASVTGSAKVHQNVSPTDVELPKSEESPIVAVPVRFELRLNSGGKQATKFIGQSISQVNGPNAAESLLKGLNFKPGATRILARFWESGHNIILIQPNSANVTAGFVAKTAELEQVLGPQLPGFEFRPRGLLVVTPQADKFVLEHEWQHSQDSDTGRMDRILELIQAAHKRGVLNLGESHHLNNFAVEYPANLRALKFLAQEIGRLPNDRSLVETRTEHLTYLVKLGLTAELAIPALKRDAQTYREIKEELLRIEAGCSPPEGLKMKDLVRSM